jgi:hypothetical protein
MINECLKCKSIVPQLQWIFEEGNTRSISLALLGITDAEKDTSV